MKYIILGGSGQQAKAIIHYLLKNTSDEIMIIDFKQPKLELSERVTFFCGDYCSIWDWNNPNTARWKPAWWKPSFSKNNIFISCLPAEHNYAISELSLSLGCSMVDLGGVTSVVGRQFKLDKDFAEKEITLVPDCGLAPGLVSSIAGYLSCLTEEDKLDLKIFCGGLPLFPLNDELNYINVFHPAGVIKEYSGVAEIISNSEVKKVPTLSELEHVFIHSLGILEADFTSGGTSVSARDLTSNVSNFQYKTLRYPGHFEYMKKNVLNQPNPTEVLSQIIRPVGRENLDLIVLNEKYILDGEKFEYTHFWVYDMVNNISAMAQATGYTVAAVATMIADKILPMGAVAMHNVPYEELRRRIKLMPNQMMDKIEDWSARDV